MSTSSVELVSTIRFAMKATKESYRPAAFGRKQAINRLGEELGHDAARVFSSNTLEELVVQLASFWASGGLGEMKIVHTDPVLIEVKNCYDCAGWNMSSSGASCAFKTSFIKTVLEDVLRRPAHLEEIECCRRPAPACLFRVSMG